ncbi:hypothetical protein [Parafilimonas sp.]|uniref:hypothetical protein n=1 Tax=Parafilimonas sp. TaxID=1969739 RepID=UPI0039E526AB
MTFRKKKTAYNVIDKAKFVTNENTNYFDKEAIELNPNLNVIIGGKSSGKSLLPYHIAKAIDPVQVSEKLGFWLMKKNMIWQTKCRILILR